MKLAAVILNYNDSSATVESAARLCSFKSISRVIIVDNKSTDGSELVLKTFTDGIEKCELVLNERNGGYGYGNNAGVKRAAELGCDAALICNPDTVFEEKAVKILSDAMEGYGAAGALNISGTGNVYAESKECAWPLADFKTELLRSGPISRRLSGSRINYSNEYFDSVLKDGKTVDADVVHGAFLMVRTDCFEEAGGYDEEMFLFGEERVLARKLESLGFKTALTPAVYSHAGSGSMKHAGMGLVKREHERLKSERYYYRTYLGAGKAEMALCYIFQAVVMLETFVYSLFVH